MLALAGTAARRPSPASSSALRPLLYARGLCAVPRGAPSILPRNFAVAVVASSRSGEEGGRRRRDDHHFRSSPPVRNFVRSFSAPPGPKDDKAKDDADDAKEADGGGGGNPLTKSLSRILSPQMQFYGLVAGGSIGAYGLSRVFLGFTGFFTHLTPTVIAKWGFYTGFGCATVVGGLALVTADNLYIRADPVYRYCLNWVANDPLVQKTLGDGIRPGALRSYRLDSGKFEYGGGRMVWRPPRIQMIFDVAATGPPYRTGIVTCEAIKAGGFPPRLSTSLLKVDYETGNEGREGGSHEGDETLFLKGDPEDFDRVSRRSGLSLDVLARSVHIERAAAGRTD